MTRPVALFAVLSLLCTSSAWAEQRREPAKKTLSAKKKKQTAKKTSKKSQRLVKPAAPAAPAAPAVSAEPAPQPLAAPEPLPAPQAVPASYSSGDAAPAKPAEDAPRSETPSKPPSAGDSESLDFDLLEPLETAEAAQVDPELEKKIGRRRTMLKLHQGLGFAMTAGLVTTTVVGQLQFNDSFRGGGDDRNLLGLHRGLAIGTAALFASVGMLGVLAPEPFEKEFQWDTITFHKIFMSIATVGMVAQVILGIMSTNRYGRLSERDLATAHQVVGYTTMGAVTAGVLSLFF
ncbi:hypothetical protein [Myxococcus sp. RHSTA-1-4]|uniref:hypothetical protein n=1 Tax=Myxococcus sp. RHSTA-1-4 TaxID=2874601 RepID=UPI001CBF8C8A|nr:hypothetical protein [Myxococcus sp. RHSTA-1-4]MBZ4419204.1 hypothetical protein [Myxococcus sp. RHSTA-1-4]